MKISEKAEKREQYGGREREREKNALRPEINYFLSANVTHFSTSTSKEYHVK